MDIKVYMDSYMASNGSRFMVTWIIFKKPPLGRRLNTKPGDYGITNTHNCIIILFYHMWRLAWIEVHWNNIWVRARSHVASPYTRDPVTTLHDFEGVLGRPLDVFSGSRNIMAMDLDSCVKWPLKRDKIPLLTKLWSMQLILHKRVWMALCNYVVVPWYEIKWIWLAHYNKCPRRLLGIISWDPSVSKSNWSHVDIFGCFFINLGIFH
jgi:hypothetical protein